jgi:hypothetical protein
MQVMMKRSEFAQASTPESLVEHVDRNAPDVLLGHRIDDAMHALLSDPLTPRQMLDVEDFYTYDNLVVS